MPNVHKKDLYLNIINSIIKHIARNELYLCQSAIYNTLHYVSVSATNKEQSVYVFIRRAIGRRQIVPTDQTPS